jgi:ABC-type glycerol-3-phosphate transport system permease component
MSAGQGTATLKQTATATAARTDVWHPKRGIKWGTVARHAVLITFCFIILFPIFWVILLSLKSFPDATQRYLWPNVFSDPLWERYEWVLTKRSDVIQNLRNSVIVTSGTLIFSTVTAVLAGYALSHLKTPFMKVITAALVASMFFPTRVTALVGIYEIQQKLGFINKPWTLVFPYTALSVAISIFIMKGVFDQVPKEIVDSSRVDGAGSFRTLVGIMLPLVRNGVVVVIIVNFVAAWGEYLLALTFMHEADNRTLPVFIARANSGVGAWLWPRLAALYILAVLPGFIAFLVSQRWYMKGLQEGALKA